MKTHLTPLHVRSGYSLLTGVAPPQRLIRRAKALGYTQMALTDINNLCAATLFYRQAEQASVRPILGAELRQEPHTAVALVAEHTGYENLCRIITRIRRKDRPDAEKPTLIDNLTELGEGLHVIVEHAHLGRALLAGGAKAKRLWVGLDPATQSHRQVRWLIEWAEKANLPLVATGKAHLLDPEDLDTARLLAAIRTGSTYDDVDAKDLPHPGAVLRSPAELREQLAAFGRAIVNNQRLAEQCRYKLLDRDPVFPHFQPPEGLSAQKFLRRLCRNAMRHRYGDTPPTGAENRLEKELDLIGRLGFCEYFLVVWDIVRYARGRNVPVAGRGSGASSLVAYLLGITNVCPLRFNIPFERFLHEGREDFPDLDVDFCWRIRDEVIEHVIDRWGADRVAMVSTHNKFQPRSALRETAKAFGLSDRQISRMLQTGPGERNTRPIASFSRRIIDFPHLLSVHPGGIVITPEPIDRYVPVQPAPKGVMITQFDKDGIEDFGLVKLDLLGNRNLSTVRGACELLGRRGEQVDVESLAPDDPATIRLLQRADTVGCNQLESPSMRNLLKMLRPADVRDVMKALALIRPGAASIGAKETFIRRHRGLQRPGDHIRQVHHVLGETYGVMLYEDDVMLVAAGMTGAPLAEADKFRRAVQKARSDAQRLKLTQQFLTRCKSNGVDVEYAKSMWVQMAKFNAYSFCRAHAASYAVLAYAGAYLKAHHPLEFWTAALNNNQSMYSARVYVEQAKRGSIRFARPHVNRSDEDFTIEGDAIRVGLSCVENLGPTGVSTILKARDEGPSKGVNDFLTETAGRYEERPFKGLSDFLTRTALGYEEARALILCGAFDWTGRTRPELIVELELFRHTRHTRHTRRPGQGGRPGRPGQKNLLAVSVNVPKLPGDYSADRKYRDERRILGFSTGEHIMSLYRPGLDGLVDTDSRRLGEKIGGRVRIAGVLEASRTTRTRTGKTMRFLTLDDEYGLFEVTVFPGAGCTGRSLSRYGPYIVTGTVQEQYDAITIAAEDIRLHRPASRKKAEAANHRTASA